VVEKPAAPAKPPATTPSAPLGVPSLPPATTPPEQGDVLGKVRTKKPQPEVKGKVGSREETTTPAVLLRPATDTVPVAAQSSGSLAQTGFDALLLGLLGGLALAGGSLLYWRSRSA
jgi:LPXTG-motif cell wall-anchored protein